jgi:hypothetical protein
MKKYKQLRSRPIEVLDKWRAEDILPIYTLDVASIDRGQIVKGTWNRLLKTSTLSQMNYFMNMVSDEEI